MKKTVNLIMKKKSPGRSEDLRGVLWSMLEKRLKQNGRRARETLDVSLVREWRTNEKQGC